MTSTYPAKLLLFGEYTIIQGGQALAVPLLRYGGQWKSQPSPSNKEKQQGLSALFDYLNEKYAKLYKLSAFERSLAAGDYFDSNIPQGYGAGSSGAVTAAVYDRFASKKIEANNPNDLKELQQQLANIESCFHGASSGADPLVCYLKKGVLFNGDSLQVIKDDQASLNGFFLIDTGVQRKTAPFVNLYKEWYKEEVYAMRLETELIPLVEEAIDFFLTKNSAGLIETIHKIGYFQFKYFSDMLPLGFRTAWLDALASEHTKLKLCGAGGGGFILGYSVDMAETKALLKNCTIIEL